MRRFRGRDFTIASCGSEALKSWTLRTWAAWSAATAFGRAVFFFLCSCSVEAALLRHFPSCLGFPHREQWWSNARLDWDSRWERRFRASTASIREVSEREIKDL